MVSIICIPKLLNANAAARGAVGTAVFLVEGTVHVW